MELVGACEAEHFLVTEFMEDGNLTQFLKAAGPDGLSSDTVKQLATHVASGLQHMHSLSLVHRDLKPDNVLLGHRDGQIRAKLAGLQSTFFFNCCILHWC